jgi:uncharacterized protein YbjT (DUF2867 family)
MQVMSDQPILVTGAAGTFGGVGRAVVERLLARELPVRAAVHREDERAAALRAMGAEVVVADLTRAPDIARALDGCGEQVLNWSGLPVVHVRPTMFQQSLVLLTGETIARDGTIRVPFGGGRTSPVDASDVADVVAIVLANPDPHIGHVYELTGPRSQTVDQLADEVSSALHRPIRYVDVPYDEWFADLRRAGLEGHVLEHVATMARLHAQNRYDRLTSDVERITGHPATSVAEFVVRHPALFGARAAAVSAAAG